MWPAAHGRYRAWFDRFVNAGSRRFRFCKFGQAMLQQRPNDASSHNYISSLPECGPSLWEQQPALFGCPKKMGQKKEIQKMSYLNSVTLVGFVGADPEQRQAKGSGASTAYRKLLICIRWEYYLANFKTAGFNRSSTPPFLILTDPVIWSAFVTIKRLRRWLLTTVSKLRRDYIMRLLSNRGCNPA
jgi:hypothetical protein